MQFTGMNAMESNAKLPLMFVLKGFDLSSNQGKERIYFNLEGFIAI